MRIYTFVSYRWDGKRYQIADAAGFNWDGPVALCDRGTSQKIANTEISNAGSDQANAQQALQATNSALTNYSNNLNNFMSFGRRIYSPNGEFMRDQNALATTTAAGGAKDLTANLALNAARTGENTASYAPTVAASQRQSSQDLTTQLANADAQRLQNLTGLNQYGVQASALPISVQQGLYGTGVGAANQALQGGASASAASPSFGDVLGTSLASALGKSVGTVGVQLCWIAAELYGGWNNPRTIVIRAWLTGPFCRTSVGPPLLALYAATGERIAAWIRREPVLRTAFRLLFNRALASADRWFVGGAHAE